MFTIHLSTGSLGLYLSVSQIILHTVNKLIYPNGKIKNNDLQFINVFNSLKEQIQYKHFRLGFKALLNTKPSPFISFIQGGAKVDL